MSTKPLTNDKIEEKIIFALSDAYREGETSGKLAEHIRLDTGGELKRYYDMLKPLRKREVIKGLKKGRYLVNVLPENEELARKKWKIEKPPYQEPQLDFRPDIKAWYEQFSYWDEFLTPWLHSKEVILFDGHLPVEHEPTYPYFKKYVERRLEKLEETPSLCLKPFDEQSKLKKMMERFNDLRDTILDEFKAIMDRKMSSIESKLPNFDENFKHQLLQLIFMRKTYEFLNQQNFDKLFAVVIGTPKNKYFLRMTGNKNFILHQVYKSKDIEEVLDLLSGEIDKSRIITRESMVELWTMISESQQMCGRIMRTLKLLCRIK